ncbi:MULTISPECIES: hypothetical protein [Microcystis]|uniref:Uncharacterized protein n=2 Tax=Microcystis TaxID=1125 RepID=L7E9B3_MICAE|nr:MULTISPECIES: hypothetical protein [Microcystis]ELP55268.1 hypothetical protein O53_4099 [Microcystis aeruginosa TAIHU98]MBD2601302.1 hypothetical protein [Microcystis viridis FACHB-1342]MCA2624905.1 hypothetical protein [Microcystis sp. M19BS1]MCA2632073.1 hypothetical protein [Microcystis sp. M20BS1]MDB9387825.1 hypothetical protein [Microcystis aeruginosa CS-583]
MRNNQVSHRVSPIEFSLVWYRRLTPQNGTFPSCPCPLPPADRLFQVSPDEKIFTPTDERGFLPYTPHPTPYTLFPVRGNQEK